MTRHEQVQVCSQCSNRTMNLQEGLLCGLTTQKATFENECPDFILDEKKQVAEAVIDTHVQEEIKSQAKKDMLYGALWFGGGCILTLADIGFIFWGAIVFGAIQFFKGVMSS